MAKVDVKSDMPGTVIALAKRPGDAVGVGEVLLVIESMKMEVDLVSPAQGHLLAYAVNVGGQVNDGVSIATIQTD